MVSWCLIMQPVAGRTNHVIMPMATELFCIVPSKELHRPHANKHMHAETLTNTSTSPEMLLSLNKITNTNTHSDTYIAENQAVGSCE